MKKLEGFDQLDENGKIKSVPVGSYIVKITDVIDNPEKECLEIYHEIIEGEYANHYTNLKNTLGGTDKSRSFKSYKNSAQRFFKGFIVAIQKSNPGFIWDWDEKKLIGKKVVAVYGEEEYVGKNDDGTKECRTMCRVQEWHSLEALKEGKIQIPPKKLLNDAQKLEIEQNKQMMEAKPEDTDPELPF